jgi:hypothetical protein
MSHIIDDKVFDRFIEAYRALIDTPVVRLVPPTSIGATIIPPPPPGYRYLKAGEYYPESYLYIKGIGTATPLWTIACHKDSCSLYRLDPSAEGLVAVIDRRRAGQPNRRGFERRVAMCTFIYSGDRRQTRRRTLSGRRAGGSGK